MKNAELAQAKPTETVSELSKRTRRFRAGRALGLLIGTAVLFGALALVSETFLNPYTMFIIARQIAFSILIALSQAVCLVVGGMNLSVGAIGSMATVILGLCFQNLGLNAWLAVPITLLFGVLAGALNGWIITGLKINSFIVTLSLMFVYMGLRSGISGGSPYTIPPDFGFIGQNAIFGFSWVFVIVCLILLATGYMFSYTVFGRQMLATGGNENAARLCGIATVGIVLRTHIISGFLAALAAVLWASMIGSCAPETGDSWLIGSFAVSIIGGTGLMGGRYLVHGYFPRWRDLCTDQLWPDRNQSQSLLCKLVSRRVNFAGHCSGSCPRNSRGEKAQALDAFTAAD